MMLVFIPLCALIPPLHVNAWHALGTFCRTGRLAVPHCVKQGRFGRVWKSQLPGRARFCFTWSCVRARLAKLNDRWRKAGVICHQLVGFGWVIPQGERQARHAESAAPLSDTPGFVRSEVVDWSWFTFNRSLRIRGLSWSSSNNCEFIDQNE